MIRRPTGAPGSSATAPSKIPTPGPMRRCAKASRSGPPPSSDRPMAGNPFSLDGKVAFVTGGNSGLGRAVALALSEAGARLAIGGRRTLRNAEVLAALGPAAAAYDLDVADEGSVE